MTAIHGVEAAIGKTREGGGHMISRADDVTVSITLISAVLEATVSVSACVYVCIGVRRARVALWIRAQMRSPA